MRRTLLALAAVLVTFAAHAAQPTTVILVRHAEKAAGAPAMNDDPPLTEAGEARAKKLAAMLAKSGVTAIYTTPFARTRNTAAPLAAALNVTPIEVKTGPPFAAEMAAKLRALPAGSTALVVGHSNSTPNVMKALGIPNPPSIDDATEFDKIFILTLTDEPKLVVLTY
jgi:phosphohistidine phosphatase SixA